MAAASGVRSGPVAADLIIGTGTVTVTACLRAARFWARPAAPLLRVANWPAPMRTLAEAGYRQRQVAVDGATRLFRRAAPAVVTAVLDELDLGGIVRDVIDEIDLPEIIRTSSGSVAGETVRDARIQVMAADDVVARWAGRVLPGRRPNHATARHDRGG